jgi:APA family basic amino acid/polyamine antiporter
MAESEQKKLKPMLGLWSATAINVGAIIGGGIFVVTGIVAGVAGSAFVVSMVISALVALLTALSFAQLTSWQPVEGSGYEYVRQLVSPFAGFLSGWMWMIGNTFGGAAVSLGFAYYLAAAFPELPVNVVAALVCLGFAALNFVGIRQSALLNNVLVVVKLAVLGFFVVFGLMYVNSVNFLPFQPFSSGVLFGAYFIFFAYGGFARATIIAEEVKDAKRNVPRAIILSLAISTFVYVLVGVVAVGLVGSKSLAASNSPLTFAIGATGSSVAMQLVSFGGLVATASVLLTAVLGVSRMAFSMARRNDLPEALNVLSVRFGTPYVSIWIVGVVMALLVLFVDLTGVVVVSTFALLFWYVLVNLSALRLRCERRLCPRFLPLLGLSSCLVLLATVFFVAPVAWTVGVAFLFAGAVIYIVRKNLRKRREITKNRITVKTV